MSRLALLFIVVCAAYAQTVESIPFRAVLSSRNEQPPLADYDASGAATIWLRLVRDASGRVTSGSVDFSFNARFPNAGTITAAHIHRGVAGVNGPVVIDARPARTDFTAATNLVMPTTQAQFSTETTNAYEAVLGLLSDPSAYYFNVHSVQFPGGVIRGQMVRAEMNLFLTEMSPANEVPPVTNITGSGVGTVMVLKSRDAAGNITSAEMLFDVNYTGMPAGYAFTAMHVHTGRAGANGPVSLDSAMTRTEGAQNGAGQVRFTAEINLTRAGALDALENMPWSPQNYYLNIHGAEHPGGVLRAQLRNPDKATFYMTATPQNEVPPINVNASGISAFTLYSIRNAAGDVTAGVGVFDVHARFPVDTRVTAMHIHDGLAGANGSVTIDSGLGSSPVLFGETGTGNIYRIFSVGSNRTATLNSILTNPERHYLNVHTSTNAAGFVRAQLAPANTALPAIGAIISSVSDGARVVGAPGALMSIYGENLAKATSTLTGYPVLENAPNSINGTSATIANLAMPVMLSSPGQLIVQVPVEAPAGSHPVVVRSTNGASAPFQLRVDEAAPNLFFDATGGLVLKNVDFSLVRPENAARAGDILILYWTGAGATVPTALPTGRIAPSTPFFNSRPVNVTVGGQNAEVIYSIATPGSVGLFQTAIRMPAGVTAGNAPVVLRVGSAASNSVPIAVR